MLNKLKLYLILYPILHLVTSILLILVLRSIFFCNIVHAEDLQQSITNMPNEKTNSYTKKILIGVGIGVLTILIIWVNYKIATNDEFVFSDDISIPVRDYCLDFFEYSTTALSKAPFSATTTSEFLIPFCGSLIFKFMQEDINNQTFIINLKSITLPANRHALRETGNIFKQLLQCYAELYSQVSNAEKPLVESLGVSHYLLKNANEFPAYTSLMYKITLNETLPEYVKCFQTLVKNLKPTK